MISAVLAKILDEAAGFVERSRAIYEFARLGRWSPSDFTSDYPEGSPVSVGHLLVDHGLQNAAVLTFLRQPYTFGSLRTEDQLRIIGLSYNNLVDWHFFPTLSGMVSVYNRTQPARVTFVPTGLDETAFTSDVIDQLSKDRPSPTIRSLDDVLVETIRQWKSNLFSDLGSKIKTADLSSLFNTLIFTRALEDEHKWRHQEFRGRKLLSELAHAENEPIGLVLTKALKILEVDSVPINDTVVKTSEIGTVLNKFKSLSIRTVQALTSAFYSSPWVPYEFDFRVISKHALSRIYERYVVELRDKTSAQLSLFRELPDEVSKKSLGAIYTPHFVARFFARAAQRKISPERFSRVTVLDPAVGSGIFLRTILERQCAPNEFGEVASDPTVAFKNVTGVDIDPNACNAASLSLTLLHLSLTGKLPKPLQLHNREFLDYASENIGKRKFDVIVTNPPFVNYERLQPAIQKRVRTFLEKSAKGRVDLYLAMLKGALDLCAPAGLILYVVPQSFLLSSAAKNLRKRISEEFDVLFLIDLTDIPVFEGVGAYVVLLVLQRRITDGAASDSCIVAKCRKDVAGALHASIRGDEVQNQSFSVYKLPQNKFAQPTWIFPDPAGQRLLQKMTSCVKLGEIVNARQGAVTGNDPVLLLDRDKPEVKADGPIWRPLLRDREMVQFRIPKQINLRIFYPFTKDGRKLTEEELQGSYPKTWQYLKHNRQGLEKRKTVERGYCKWWQPAWPRNPAEMLGPKIVCPHLMLTPRFAADLSGTFVVSHSLFLVPKAKHDAAQLLPILTAALNTPFFFWQLQLFSHKYSKGYVKIEPMTIRDALVPDPASMGGALRNEVVECVSTLERANISETRFTEVYLHLVELMREAYGLDSSDARKMGWYDAATPYYFR